METRALGRSGLVVSAIGLGAGPLGDARLDDADAARLVHAALDRGVTLFDTARSYGASEDRLGRALEGRRRDVVLVTKGGYGVEGVADWTPDVIHAGVEGALRRLHVEVIDVFMLHSCDRERLARGDLLDALDRAKEQGKIRLAGYSGEGDALAWAVSSGRVDVVECSVSVFDQGSIARVLPEAAERGVGVLAKRPLANAPWRFDEPPAAADVRAYWDRARAMQLDPSPSTWPDATLRFSAFTRGVSCALVGTSQIAHLDDACTSIARGPLDDATTTRFRAAWRDEWPGIV